MRVKPSFEEIEKEKEQTPIGEKCIEFFNSIFDQPVGARSLQKIKNE